MYERRTGSYDSIPRAMERYINENGCHFNRKLAEHAAKGMYRKSGGGKEYIEPYTNEQVAQLLAKYGIRLDRDALWDKAYAANMCKADFLGGAVPNEECLAKFVKGMVDDPDADEGYMFNRYYADSVFMGRPIDWEAML